MATPEPNEEPVHVDSTSEDAAPPPLAEGEEEPLTDNILKGLYILPPRQRVANAAAVKSNVKQQQQQQQQSAVVDGLALPPLRLEEPVVSIRTALAEVVGYAHLTSFRLELEAIESVETNGGLVGATTTSSSSSLLPSSVISPYTGKNAVISIPVQYKSTTSLVLDEYGDLTGLADNLQDGMGFRIVLERYDGALLKDHIIRVRSLLDGNPPSVLSLVEETVVESENNDNNKESDGEENADSSATTSAGQNKATKSLPELKPLLSPSDVAVDGTNLSDFFYLSFGEDANEIHKADSNFGSTTTSSLKSKNKKKKNKNGGIHDTQTTMPSLSDLGEDEIVVLREQIPLWNQLEEKVRVRCTIQYSGFHPPPSHRRLVGDLAYLSVIMNDGAEVLQVTATIFGFYINRCLKNQFDPTPAAEPHFSHTLLDCLLSVSDWFRDAWTVALKASRERAMLTRILNDNSHISGLFRSAIRGDFDGFTSPAVAMKATTEALDALQLTPSWVAPVPRKFATSDYAWKRNLYHSINPHRADDEIQRTFGVEIRNGSLRDWNEELQLSREMPTETLDQRTERARVMHKVLSEFGEASLLGVMAISEGQISPMNPNEATRSQVYLHNNIFFSRGVDAGPETFKISKGDKAARKSSNRDLQCIGTFHRMEQKGIYTLATVLIDYLGTRFVCQSILPGILVGEKSHTLLYGSVETGIPLKWDKDLQELLEEKIGDGMMIATRPILRSPLTQSRLEEINMQKKSVPHLSEIEKKSDEALGSVEGNEFVSSCLPVEAKGILGSDQRKYILDLSRLTPRDANWVPQEQGGTGRFEAVTRKENGKLGDHIPPTLDDDEWTMCVLRSELVTRFTQARLAKFALSQKKKDETENNPPESNSTSSVPSANTEEPSDVNPDVDDGTNDGVETEGGTPKHSEMESQYYQKLKLNLNVFLPHVRTFEGINEQAVSQVKEDEQLVRDVAEFLWDEVLPKITHAIREGAVHQAPVDGKTLTEFLHRHGVNCRYLGRLASLARDYEERDFKIDSDLKSGKINIIERKIMPRYWLELIECEMVARAAKHVLDDYLTTNGGVAALQPAQTVASFLSALVSEAEETAAQTEYRMERKPAEEPDEDEIGSLTIGDLGGDDTVVPPPMKSRTEVWHDIETEVGRRFRYHLSLFNRGNKSGRALYIPLLRRVCLRTGVRLLAKSYDVGGRCYCGGSSTFGGRLAPSYPISPLDVADIVPLMKHAAAYGEGFTPCTVGATIGMPPLQVSLQDARIALERAHIQVAGRALGKGLELAQEAGALYQRVTDNTLHPGVIESIDLMATIFLEAGDAYNATLNGQKALGLTVQCTGFDSAATLNAHMSLFQMLFSAHEMDQAIKHLRAAMYLLEVMVGPRHTDHYTAYHKLGTVYSHVEYKSKYLTTALECFREAKQRDSCDRLMDGFMAKNFAKVLAGLENYKDALEHEQQALRTLSFFLGKDHQVTQECEAMLVSLAKLAMGKGNRKEANDKLRADAAKADSIAADLAAEEEREKKKNTKKKKRGNK